METLIFNTLQGATIAVGNLPNDADLPKRQREQMAAKNVLETLLNKNVEIIHDADGKPFLKDNTLKISISHSKTKIAVIIHPEKNVGIDIEEITPKILRIAPRFLSAKELATIAQSAENYTVAWAAKEAAYKITGKAAVDFSASLEIQTLFAKSKTEGEIELKFLPQKLIIPFYYKILDNNVLVYS
ncbi:hypothetical protein FACS189429_3150 [Bacteroidia bacterium]|nr:hypothetical protein FACS189429_3150 [Bacteroidia bacterium]